MIMNQTTILNDTTTANLKIIEGFNNNNNNTTAVAQTRITVEGT